MTEPMGYNDQFDDLPNEDASWEKMNRLLDEEEKKRRVLPFWLRFSGLCILLIGAAVGGYVMVNGDNANEAVTEADFPERTQSPKPVTTTGAKETNITSEHSETTANTDNKLSPQHRNTTVQAGKQSATETSQDNIEVQKKVTVETASPKKPVTYQNNSGNVSKKTVSRNAGSVVLRDKVQKKKTDPVAQNATPVVKNKLASVQSKSKIEPGKTTDSVAKNIVVSSTPDTAQISKTAGMLPSDTTIKKQDPANPADSTKTKEAVADNKEKTRKKSAWKWSMAVSFQEPLAIGSQQSSEYNYMGKRSWMGDHLPGLYLAATRNRWLLSAQFNYRVPQPVERISFSQATKYSPATAKVNTERYSVEKLYYHQLTASGGYFVHPRISGELGGSYHLLAGAVTERNSKSVDVITGNTTTFSELAPVKGFKDSFLFRSTVGAMAGFTYHWKKLQIGVRYHYSLQPYMRYTKPDGTVEDVKNNTLALIARLQLWKQ